MLIPAGENPGDMLIVNSHVVNPRVIIIETLNYNDDALSSRKRR